MRWPMRTFFRKCYFCWYLMYEQEFNTWMEREECGEGREYFRVYEVEGTKCAKTLRLESSWHIWEAKNGQRGFETWKIRGTERKLNEKAGGKWAWCYSVEGAQTSVSFWASFYMPNWRKALYTVGWALGSVGQALGFSNGPLETPAPLAE